MTTEHDFDGHGGCVPDCSQCRIEEQAATIARLEGELALSHQRLDETRILLDVAMGQREQAEAERDSLRARVASLQARVEDLEPAFLKLLSTLDEDVPGDICNEEPPPWSEVGQ